MRRIVTAISGAALALSMVASAIPANAAVAGYDSAYLAQSDWLVRDPGQTGSWTVIYQNTGTTTWTRGTSTEVEFAQCLADKVTCNQQDATEAPFNNGWLTPTTRYSDMNQTAVAPGQAASFTVNIAVPAAQAAGTYRFNGAVVKADTGADIRNEGAFFDVLVPGAATGGTAATITSISPTTGSTAGGTVVTVTGTGFVCTPATPTVNFGTSAGTVTSCGATTITVTSPAGTAGAANLTVTNTGAAASNTVTYVYADTTRPTYNSVTSTGALAGGTAVATVTFSEPVCNPVASPGTASTDWTVSVNGATGTVSAESAPLCNSTTAPTNGVTSFNVFFTAASSGPVPNGALVALTLNEAGATVGRNANYVDAAVLTATAPRTNTTNATAPDTTAPTLTGASGTGGSTTLTLTFSEPVWCADPLDAGDVTITTGTTTIASTATNTCEATAAAATSSYTVTLASAMASQTSYSVTLTTIANETQDASGTDIVSPATTSFTSAVTDASPPTLTDTRVVTNAGLTSNFDSADVFTITFSEAMNTTTVGDTIQIQDTDNAPAAGDIATITCTGNATCAFNTAGTILTVTITGAVLSGTSAGISYPATIISLGGFSDTGGNGPNLAGSADRIIDVE